MSSLESRNWVRAAWHNGQIVDSDGRMVAIAVTPEIVGAHNPGVAIRRMIEANKRFKRPADDQ